jgi:hypothetical protein
MGGSLSAGQDVDAPVAHALCPTVQVRVGRRTHTAAGKTRVATVAPVGNDSLRRGGRRNSHHSVDELSNGDGGADNLRHYNGHRDGQGDRHHGPLHRLLAQAQIALLILVVLLFGFVISDVDKVLRRFRDFVLLVLYKQQTQLEATSRGKTHTERRQQQKQKSETYIGSDGVVYG